jgi:hypothetical protein
LYRQEFVLSAEYQQHKAVCVPIQHGIVSLLYQKEKQDCLCIFSDGIDIKMFQPLLLVKLTGKIMMTADIH